MQILNCRYCGTTPLLIDTDEEGKKAKKGEKKRVKIRCDNSECPRSPRVSCLEPTRAYQGEAVNTTEMWNALMEAPCTKP